MCIREGIDTRKSLEFTELQQDTKIHAVNLSQSASITELRRIQVLTGTCEYVVDGNEPGTT